MEDEYLVGMNNFCLTTHTMLKIKDDKLLEFSLRDNLMISFGIKEFELKEVPKFDYKNLISEGEDG